MTGSSENCLSDAASRPANSAAQGAPNARPAHRYIRARAASFAFEYTRAIRADETLFSP
jgi:hypothetical protein